METIGIFIGPHFYGKCWDEKNKETRGIGGSELWAIELADEFARSGDKVYIFGVPEYEHECSNGVVYKRYENFFSTIENIKFDRIIMSRRVDAIYDTIPCDNIYLMCHDCVIVSAINKDSLRLSKINKIFQQSTYQKEILKSRYGLNDSVFARTYQGIDVESYLHVDDSKKKNKTLLSQGKVRGIEWVIKNVFPLIKAEVPDFEIDLCGYASDYEEDIYKQEGINILGSLTKDELIARQKESKIWIYPNYGIESTGEQCGETFSITTIENAMARCACILGDWGPWHTTLEGYKYFVGNDLYENILTPMKQENWGKFAREIADMAIKCLKDEEYRLKLVEDSYNIAKKYTWKFVADSFREEWEKERKAVKNDELKTMLCCIGRLENQYIREYVEYYKNLGVSNICLFDNNYDGEDDFRDVIGDYIDSGFVILKDYRNRKVCQLDAYNECYSIYGNEYDWIAFFDIDEFMFIHGNNTINEYLSQKEFSNYDMIHINWLLLGDGDVLKNDGSPLLQRITKPLDINLQTQYSFPDNFHVKSIIRGGLKKVIWNQTSHTPTNDIKCCDASGDKCRCNSPFTPYDFRKAGLLHFTTKTAEEFAIKVKRGFPDGNPTTKEQMIESFFKRNKVTKEKIQIFNDILGVDMSHLLPYEGEKNKDIQIYSLCYSKKNFKFLNDSVITPLQVGAANGTNVCELKDNIGDNISDKNYFYIENTGTYWIWKNVTGAKYKGQMQYRRPLDGVNENLDFDDVFSRYKVITCEPFNHPANSQPTNENPMFIPAMTVEQGYAFSNCIDDLRVIEMVIELYYPEYKESYIKYIKNGENLYYSNGFIMKSEDFDKYCEFLFDCLDKYQQFVDVSTPQKLMERVVYNMEVGKYPKHMSPETRTKEGIRWQMSIGGFLSERLWTLWLLHNFKDEEIMKLPYNKMEENMYT